VVGDLWGFAVAVDVLAMLRGVFVSFTTIFLSGEVLFGGVLWSLVAARVTGEIAFDGVVVTVDFLGDCLPFPTPITSFLGDVTVGSPDAARVAAASASDEWLVDAGCAAVPSSNKISGAHQDYRHIILQKE